MSYHFMIRTKIHKLFRDRPKHCIWDAKGNQLQSGGKRSRVHFILLYKVNPHPCVNE